MSALDDIINLEQNIHAWLKAQADYVLRIAQSKDTLFQLTEKVEAVERKQNIHRRNRLHMKNTADHVDLVEFKATNKGLGQALAEMEELQIQLATTQSFIETLQRLHDQLDKE